MFVIRYLKTTTADTKEIITTVDYLKYNYTVCLYYRVTALLNKSRT